MHLNKQTFPDSQHSSHRPSILGLIHRVPIHLPLPVFPSGPNPGSIAASCRRRAVFPSPPSVLFQARPPRRRKNTGVCGALHQTQYHVICCLRTHQSWTPTLRPPTSIFLVRTLTARSTVAGRTAVASVSRRPRGSGRRGSYSGTCKFILGTSLGHATYAASPSQPSRHASSTC